MRTLELDGFTAKGPVHWNSPSPLLYEHAVAKGLAQIAHKGPLVIDTTPYTGRSPKDKFIVETAADLDVWWGEVNQPFSLKNYQALKARVASYLSERELYVQDLYVGADPRYRLQVRVISESPAHALFSRNMFILPRKWEEQESLANAASRYAGILPEEEFEAFIPNFTILHAPSFKANPARDGTRSEAFVVLNFQEGVLLIGGTPYAGEIKKGMFTVMNYLMPAHQVLPMHCSANIDPDGNSALFFGLSGTGKTTLSTDPERKLIGDDEHGWSDTGIFNFEGGCYAKVIRLSRQNEPLIWSATNQFETILENVVINPESRRIEYDDASKTENTRSSYPLSHLGEASAPLGQGNHPKHIFFLSADAFGVLPPIARLTPEQAMFYFLSGYTAKVAGTERGITEPQATFSACFGAPFLPREPGVYAALLGEKIRRHQPQVWLVNTGWSGGGYGTGTRISLQHTRALLHAALQGHLEGASFSKDSAFGLAIPEEVPGVPPEILNPRQAWADPSAYDQAAQSLAVLFQENFQRYSAGVAPEICAAGPAPS